MSECITWKKDTDVKYTYKKNNNSINMQQNKYAGEKKLCRQQHLETERKQSIA